MYKEQGPMSPQPSVDLAEKPTITPYEGDDNVSVKENKAVIRRWIEARNTDDVEAAANQ